MKFIYDSFTTYSINSVDLKTVLLKILILCFCILYKPCPLKSGLTYMYMPMNRKTSWIWSINKYLPSNDCIQVINYCLIYGITRTLFRIHLNTKLTLSIVASLPGTQIVGAAILKWMNSSTYREYRLINNEIPNFYRPYSGEINPNFMFKYFLCTVLSFWYI